MGKKRTILLALVIGFAAAMVLMSVRIYFGYCDAYCTGVEKYTVRLLGISIYELTRTETGYASASIGPNMGVICGICMVISLAVERVFHQLRRRKSSV